MIYQEIDIGDHVPDGITEPRVYLVPDTDGISILYRDPDPRQPECEIFLSATEVQRLIGLAPGLLEATAVEMLSDHKEAPQKRGEG